MANLEDQIREAIASVGQTRRRIARETGISEAHLSRFMSGQRGLGVAMLERLAKYLDLDIVMRPKRQKKGRPTDGAQKKSRQRTR